MLIYFGTAVGNPSFIQRICSKYLHIRNVLAFSTLESTDGITVMLPGFYMVVALGLLRDERTLYMNQ